MTLTPISNSIKLKIYSNILSGIPWQCILGATMKATSAKPVVPPYNEDKGSLPAAFNSRTDAGGVFKMNVKLLSCITKLQEKLQFVILFTRHKFMFEAKFSFERQIQAKSKLGIWITIYINDLKYS